jgi:hypothetical protein
MEILYIDALAFCFGKRQFTKATEHRIQKSLYSNEKVGHKCLKL